MVQEAVVYKQMLTVREAASLLKLHELTVRKMCLAGDLPAAKIGRQWRFDPDILDDWIAEQTQATLSRGKGG